MEEKEEKKRKKRKLIILFIWAILLFLLLSSSTYAWFTVNRVVSIDALDVHVDVKGGIEISTDSIDWKTALTSDDIISAHNTYELSNNQMPSFLMPVSTGGEVGSNHYLNMYYGLAQSVDNRTYFTLNSSLEHEKEGSGVDGGKFIAFDAFLRINTTSPLYLANFSGSTIPEGLESTGIENALRVAIVFQGRTEIESGYLTAQKLLNATSKDVMIWEPNYDEHTEFGVSHALDTYGIRTTKTNGAQIPYDGVISEFTMKDDIPVSKAFESYYPNLFKKMNVDIATKKDFNKNVLMKESLERGIYKIRIYIWIEGQDVDCEDNASYGDILFTLGFTTLSE